MKRWLFILVLGAVIVRPAIAHEVRPAYLELREIAPETYDVLWKVPARGRDERLGIYVSMPADAEAVGEPRGMFAGGAYLERWRVRRPGGLEGQTIAIDGLDATGTEVLVRLERADGSSQSTRLLPSRRTFVVEQAPTAWGVATTYLGLGVEHILGGVDHLLFVLALLMLVRNLKRLIGVVTAFTVAHSLTLAGATLGFVRVPQAPVEAVIALSIAFVAAEIVRARQGKAGLSGRWPWIVAFLFGLLHGFGFAGALRQIGLPPGAIPAALLTFNIGVELGQLSFIVVVAGIGWTARAALRSDVEWPDWAWRVPPYAIGGVSMFWVIQRVGAY